MHGTDCPHSNRQHNCSLLHQQRGRYEIWFSLCPTLEAPILVSSQEDSSAGQTHPRSLECHSGQAIPAQSSDPDRVVPVSTGVQSLVLHLGPTTDRSFCHPIQSQASQVCLSGSGLDSLGGGCSQPVMEQPGRVCFSSSLPSQSGHIQTGEPGLSQDINRSGLAEHALVLGSDQSIKSDSRQSSLGEGPIDSTVQRPSPQELKSSKSACLAPRASSIRQQGFSEEVAARIEAPQRSSTRAVYKSKWAIFVKWCESNQVDFRSPSLKQVADFLLYLFKERQLQPSTIEGYGTAIADMVGNDLVHFGKDESLTRLLDSFHRDKPKGRRGVPAWNLSLVLHQLTKAPFEPMRKASLKHLTFKTVFLLALGSGKRRSEIHAWLYRNIRHQENWSQVSLYPSPGFLSKNQLARDGPAAVAPVVIPALAPSLDRSLKEDKSLCPVRALRYYLDRTKDLRSGKDLVFVSFRKSFQKDIVPATVSSWIKQTVSQVFHGKESLSIYGSSFRARHSSTGIYQGSQGGETDGSSTGYPDPPVPRRLVSHNPGPGTCRLHTQTLLALCRDLGWVVNMEKSELTPQQVFNFVGYRFDLLSGRVLPTQDRWITLQQKLQFIKGRDSCSVRQFMSLIGLLTATEKQVWAGRLHMRPVQWHLKRHWHVPESLEKIIPIHLSLYPHLDWWLEESNELKGQPLHPLQHALQIFTDASNEGWGAHLGGSTARGVWSEPESRLHINFLELKAVLLALKSFEQQCTGQIVLIATDNTTVVSYINKEGAMRSGSLCALLWRLLSWCHPRKIVLRARHIPGRLNVIADKLSRHNQVIQTEWCLSQQVFNRLCSTWGQPQIDLFATRFNHKLPKFVSPVPDSTAWAVDALSLSWNNLDVYAFPPVSLLSQVISKLVNQGFHRILIAPGWPNMPWFWDLISLSSQIPVSLPLERDLLTQPFNGLLHRNLNHLNLHAWLLEPRPSGNKGFLRRWQQELKLLKEVQPELSISQSGPFLLSGANPTRWTSGRPL